jgi:hypothetical protein
VVLALVSLVLARPDATSAAAADLCVAAAAGHSDEALLRQAERQAVDIGANPGEIVAEAAFECDLPVGVLMPEVESDDEDDAIEDGEDG